MTPQTVLAMPDWVAQQNCQDWLSQPELAEWAGFASPKRRAEWLAGQLAAKRLLQETWGIAPHDCFVAREGVAPQARGPIPDGINLSISHSGGLGAASWAWTATQGTVGLDVQRIRPVHSRLAARILSEDERAQWETLFPLSEREAGLLLFWALKEAAIKARRLPWPGALRDLRVTLSASSATATILVPNELSCTAVYERWEQDWLARALRPSCFPIIEG